MTKPIDVQAYLPLTEVTYFILLTLAHRPRHGYAIMQDVYTLSHERLELSTGTLYGALPRLLEQGWIERLEGDHGTHNGRARKEYELTALGRTILEAEVNRLNQLLTAARVNPVGKTAR